MPIELINRGNIRLTTRLSTLNIYKMRMQNVVHTGIKFALMKSDPSTSSNGANVTREWSTGMEKKTSGKHVRVIHTP